MDRRSFLVRLATGSVAISTSGWTQMSALYPFTAGQPSTEGSENLDARLRSISERLETYLFDHFFDGDGILYAYIDVETGKPFTPEYMSTQYLDIFHVPDPVHYWSNEDSMQYSGYLLAALYEKYTATRDSRVVDQMSAIYRGIRKVYDYSQTLEPNSFSRPYGGLQSMAKYRECLGTDQAQSLFWGLWLFSQLADEATKSQINEMNISALEWYRRQDYSYLYYQMHVHGSRRNDMRHGGHSVCYYLPCLMWAYKVSGNKKYYDDYLRLWEEQWFECSGANMNRAWKHRHNLRWLKDLAPERAFWQRALDRSIDIDISLFNGKEPSRVEGTFGGDQNQWLMTPIDRDGLCHEWRSAEDEEFKTGLTKEEREWLAEWRSVSREKKRVILRSRRQRHGEPDGLNRKNWFPGEKRNLYRHKAKLLPIAKIKDITMAGLYENRALDLIEKAKRYLASYDRLHFYTVVIDPDHTLIPEKDIEFPSRSIASGLVSFWLLAYWTLRRLERR